MSGLEGIREARPWFEFAKEDPEMLHKNGNGTGITVFISIIKCIPSLTDRARVSDAAVSACAY